MRILTLLILAAFTTSCTSFSSGYHLTKSIPVSGNGGWDYLTVDEFARQLYVSHNTKVDVLDADSGEVKGSIPNTNGVHGIAIASELGKGFTSNGKADSVTIFDLKTFKTLSQIKTGKKPDAIVYDSASHRIFAFNGESESATVINARNGKSVETVALGGAPEFAVADGKGHVFVNLEDKNELLKIDSKKLKILQRWALAPGESPSSLAMDQKNHRLFVGCRNKLLLVVNADNGKVIDRIPIGEGVDATAFDPVTKQIISTTGDGTISIIQQENPDSYTVADTVTTQKRSKTFALDSKTHRLFVPAAEFEPAAPPTSENPKPRPSVIPGSFAILVFDK